MTAVAAVRAAMHRLDQAERLGAVVARDDDATLAAAERADREHATTPERLRPLLGRAVTVKDWIDVAGLPCEGESATRTGRVPSRNAAAVARLQAAGAVVVAKTQPGPDHPLHGRCLHPTDPTRSPGGSSSGEATLVASGASGLGLGSDSGGSIRLPAAWCGAAGLKPSYGLVPTSGHHPPAGEHGDGRTVIGPLARSVADLALALAIIAGPDGSDPAAVPVQPGDPAAVTPAGLRVAVLRGESRWQPATSTADAVERAAAHLAARGAVVLDDALPPHLDDALALTQRYWAREERTGREVQADLEAWDDLAVRLTRAIGGFDAILGPTVADVAPLRRDLRGEDYVFTLAWSLTGWPAVTVPFGRDAATGLPLAVQVAAPRWRDHVALAVGGWLEEAVAPRA